MSALVERHGDIVVGDVYGGGNVEEVSEDFFRLSSIVLATDLVRHESIERTGNESDLQVEIDFESDHGREGVDVKELDGFGDAVFNEHALGIAGDQGGATDFEVIGEDNSGFFMAEIGHGDLA